MFVLSGFGFFPGIFKCAFLAMWESLLRGLTIKGFFGDIVSRNRNGYVRINTDEAVTIIALTYFYRDRKVFADAWGPAFKGELRGSVDKCVNVIRRQVFNLHGSKGNMLCPTRYSLGRGVCGLMQRWSIDRALSRRRCRPSDSRIGTGIRTLGRVKLLSSTWSSFYPNST